MFKPERDSPVNGQRVPGLGSRMNSGITVVDLPAAIAEQSNGFASVLNMRPTMTVVHKNYLVPVFKFPYTVDLSDLPNALYLIRLNSSVLNEAQKIILAR